MKWFIVRKQDNNLSCVFDHCFLFFIFFFTLEYEIAQESVLYGHRKWQWLCIVILLQRLRSPVREAFSYGIRHVPLWFIEAWGHTPLIHNEICRIPYENASRAGLRNLCIVYKKRHMNQIRRISLAKFIHKNSNCKQNSEIPYLERIVILPLVLKKSWLSVIETCTSVICGPDITKIHSLFRRHIVFASVILFENLAANQYIPWL